MFGVDTIIDILFLCSGVYLIYTGIRAKTRGEITANVMLSKSVKESAIKDRDGFIEFMYKKLIAIGIVVIAAGVIDTVNEYWIQSFALTCIRALMVLAALAIYTVSCQKGQRQYMQTQEKGKKK